MDFWFRIGAVITFIATFSNGRQTDDRWLEQPEMKVKVIEGENVTLRWIYKMPPPTPNKGKLTFALHVPGNNFEEMLMEALIDAQTGAASILYSMSDDKIGLTCNKQEISLEIGNVTLRDQGRYLLNLNFDSDAAMYDVLSVIVFKSPFWKETPREEILAKTKGHVTMKWKRDSASGQPEIRDVTLLYTEIGESNSVDVIITHKNPDSGMWTTEFPEEGQRLSDRMLHEYNPERDVFLVSLWDLEPDDSGQYELRLAFEDDVTEMAHSVMLHVTKGSTWRKTPPREVYGVLSNDVNMTYEPAVNDTAHAQYRLYRYQNKREEEIITVSVNGNDVTERRSRSVDFSDNIQIMFDDQYSGMTLTFHDLQSECNGSYLLKMFLDETLTVKHNFNLHVLPENNIWPTLEVNDVDIDIKQGTVANSEAGLYKMILPAQIPHPHVTMYTGSDDDRVVYVDVKDAEIIAVSLEESVLAARVTVVVDYAFYRITFQLESDIKVQGVSQATMFSVLSQGTRDAIIVYVTCFCLLFGHVILIIVSCCSWKTQRDHNCCHCKNTHIHLESPGPRAVDNFYETASASHLPLSEPNKHNGSPQSAHLKQRRPFAQDKGSNPSDSGYSDDSNGLDRDWIQSDELAPLVPSSTPHVIPMDSLESSNPKYSNPSSLKGNGKKDGGSPKRVRWEGIPRLPYEQVEQHSPKLPRY